MVKSLKVLIVSNVVDATFIDEAVWASKLGTPTTVVGIVESGAIRDWADDVGIPFKWYKLKKGGKSLARLQRNLEITRECDAMIAVLSKSDKARACTDASIKSMISLMQEKHIPVFVTRITMTETQRMNY